MPYHTPERKTEQALKLYFETVLGYELEDVQITTRFSNTEMTEPRIEIYCPACRPWDEVSSPYSGNWAVDCVLKVVTHYEPSVDDEAHDNIAGNLLDNLMVVDGDGNEATASEINATQDESDFTVIVVDIGERTNEVEEHSLVTQQALTLYIQPSR